MSLNENKVEVKKAPKQCFNSVIKKKVIGRSWKNSRLGVGEAKT